MSEKQRLITANTRFDQTLLKMIDELEEQQKAEGQYVWKKWENPEVLIVENPTITFNGNLEAGSTVTSDVVDLSLVTEEFFDGFVRNADTTASLKMVNGSLCFVNQWGSFACSYDPVTQKMVIGTSGTFTNDVFTYTGTKEFGTRGTFAGYVVAEDESTYPDSGEQGGCFYQKMVLNEEMGTFTIPSGTAWNAVITIPHSLGKIPTEIDITFTPDSVMSIPNSGNLFFQCVNGVPYFFNYTNRAVYEGSSVYFGVVADENTITITNNSGSSNYGFWAGLYTYKIRG